MSSVPSILITDDDLEFRETLRGVLEPVGYRTLLAGDGEEALAIVRSEEVHLVLLDMHMPKLTGLEVVQLIRQFRALLPFILMSANLDEQVLREAQRLHAASVLSKPVSHREVRTTVQRALRLACGWPEMRP